MTGELAWVSNEGPITVAHADTTSALTLSVRYDGGEVRLREVELAGDFPFGQEGGQPCSNVLEMDVTLEMSTDDGVFAETLAVPLLSYSHGGYGDPEQQIPNIYQALDLDAAGGSISAADFTVSDGEFRQLIVTAQFPEGAPATGTVLLETGSGDGDEGWIGAGSVATFEASAP